MGGATILMKTTHSIKSIYLEGTQTVGEHNNTDKGG